MITEAVDTMRSRTGPTGSWHRSLLGLVAVIHVVVALSASCGVGTGDSSFEEIDGEELPGGLNDPTTTTSTSTTTTTTSTMPETPDSTVATTTTTTAAMPARLVDVYFITRGKLVAVPTELAVGSTELTVGTTAPTVDSTENPSLSELVVELEQGPPRGPTGTGLASFVSRGLIAGAPSAEFGIITVALDGPTYDRIQDGNQREALAQIALTLLSNTTGNGQVTFTIDGEELNVLADTGSKSRLSADDFDLLLSGSTSTTTTTTGPPDEFDATTPSITTTTTTATTTTTTS